MWQLWYCSIQSLLFILLQLLILCALIKFCFDVVVVFGYLDTNFSDTFSFRVEGRMQ